MSSSGSVRAHFGWGAVQIKDAVPTRIASCSPP